MRLYIDLDLLRVVAVPGYTAAVDPVTVRRNDTLPLIVQFVEDGYVVDPGAAATTLYFAANSNGNYTQNPNLIAVALTKTGTGAETQYAADVPIFNSSINTAFAAEPASIPAMAELTWYDAGGTASVTTEQFPLTIENRIYRGSVIPSTAPTQAAAIFLPGVTGLTGGGATNLDGVLTAGISVPQVYILSISTSSQLWILQAGTDAENAAGGIVRPDDYNASTNAKVFKRIG